MKTIGLIFLVAMTAPTQAMMREPGGDFVVETLSAQTIAMLPQTRRLRPPSADPIQDCVDHIQQVACLTDKSMGNDPTCSSARVTPEMLKLFPDLIRALPPFHQLVLCHVNRLQIHTRLFSIGYASGWEDANHKQIGNMIGLRLDVLLGSNPAHDVWSWKEQLNFGLRQMNDPDYKISPEGPVIVEQIGGPDTLLTSVMTHELGHLIDFMNAVNKDDCTEDKITGTFHCQFADDSFTALSWGKSATYRRGERGPPPEHRALYPWLSQLCYYFCSQPIPPAKIVDVYAELRGSSLLTSYSASSAMEDFAEASMIYSLKKAGLSFSYDIHGKAGTLLFDFDAQWTAPQNQPKRLWLEAFFARPDLTYEFHP